MTANTIGMTGLGYSRLPARLASLTELTRIEPVHLERLEKQGVFTTGILLEATFTPLAFGGAWLLGAGESHQRAMLDFGHVGSIGVHLCDESSGRVGLGAEGSLRASYKLLKSDAEKLSFGIALAAEVHFEPRLNAPRLIETIRRERISVLAGVPRVLALLKTHLEAEHPNLPARIESPKASPHKSAGGASATSTPPSASSSGPSSPEAAPSRAQSSSSGTP